MAEERELPWFRAYTDAATDPKFTIVSQITGVHPMVVFGVWFELLCLAGRSPVRGSLYITETKPYGIMELAAITRLDEEAVKSLMDAFMDVGMVGTEEGTYTITNWDKRQYTSDSSADRVRKHRTKQPVCNGDVTLHDRYSNVTVTPPETDTENREQITETETETTDVVSPDPRFERVLSAWAEKIGPITGTTGEILRDACDTYPEDWLIAAFKAANMSGKRHWTYILGILKNYSAQGGPQARAAPAQVQKVDPLTEAINKRRGVTDGIT